MTEEPTEVRKLREKELQGEKLNKIHNEAVVFLSYLEEYMNKFGSNKVSYEEAREELLNKRPANFIIQRLRQETFAQNNAYFDKMKGNILISEEINNKIDL
jgi:hypothetical protein